MVDIVIVCLYSFLLPEEVFAAHFPPIRRRVAARPELRTTAAIPLMTPSHSNLDAFPSETTELAPFPVDLGRRQQIKPTVQSIPGVSYLGCWVDNSSRIVGAILTLASDMTPASCRDLCFSRSYSVFGVEAAEWCLCDSTISSWAVKTAETDCSVACHGNAAVVCGAGWRINVYSQTSHTSSISSSSITTSSTITPSSSITPSSINVTSTLPLPNSSSVSSPTIQLPSSSSNITSVGMSPGEIAGITVGAIIGGAVVATLAVYLVFVLPRKRNKQSITNHNQQPNHPPEAQDISKPGAVQELPGVMVVQELPAN